MVTKLNHQVFCSCSTDNIQNWRTEPSRAAQYKTTPEYVVKNRLRRELQHQTRTEVCGRLFGMVCPLFCGMFSVVSDRGALGVVPRNLWCGPGSTERSARGGHWPLVTWWSLAKCSFIRAHTVLTVRGCSARTELKWRCSDSAD